MKPLTTLPVALALVGNFAVASAGVADAEGLRPRPRCFGEVATIVGGDGDNVLRGTRHRDVIVAGAGNDSVVGRGGNDLICGGAGLDALDGGPGDDRISGGTDLRYTDEGETVLVGDDLWGGPGDDRITPGFDMRIADRVERDRVRWDRVSQAVSIDLRTGRATGQGRDTFAPRHVRVVGSDRGDTVTGSRYADWIITGDGHDTIRAGAGDDIVWSDFAPDDGPDGADVAYGGAGDDQVYGEGGDDQLSGGSGDDQVVDYGDSADTVSGGSGRDLVGDQMVSDAAGPPQSVNGGSGRDTIDLFSRFVNPNGLAGPPSHGTFDMASGAVTYEDPDDSVTMTVASTEVVTLLTWGTVWDITGTLDDDMLCAGGSNGTTFHALGGNDSFQGSPGDDVYDGGPGTDTLIGTSVGNDQNLNVESSADGLCGDFDLGVHRLRKGSELRKPAY